MEDAGRTPSVLTAREAGLCGCRRCGRVNPGNAERCERCGSRVSMPDAASLQRVWAWLLAGLIFYIPANAYPMLRTTTFGRTRENTIVGGVIELGQHGDYLVAVIVFVASVLIPLSKFAAIAYLSLSITREFRVSSHRAQVLFEVVDFIGRWSMIDVFVVAILVALVQFEFTASIQPGIAAVSFALSVVFTMIAALSFDSRLLWLRHSARRPRRAIG